ncbi:MAG: zinc-binding alcohol dehydrogenase family protein [Microbacteriaceae bacterium]
MASRTIGREAQPGGGLNQFAERHDPLGELGVNDLRVEVLAASVNPVDPKLFCKVGPFTVLGYDGVGVVTETGRAVARFSPGDRVYYSGTLERAGSNQTAQLVDERIAALAPASLTASQAASLPLTSITAWESLFVKLRLHEGSAGTLLMVGGAGGVGSMVIQVARALLPGVTIVATASRPDSVEWVRSLGAHHVVDPRTLELDGRELQNIDWIISAWSAGRIGDFARVLRPFGEIVGIDSGPIDVTPLKSRSATWHWEYMFTRANPTSTADDHHHRILASITELVDAGRIRSTDTVTLDGLSIETLTEAHRLVASGTTIGKVVISYT